ncbi:UNVERIFIED_CONTAM: putative polyamine transporter [Sesamum calycinum]|uniref:Polyamine transporter n=1 Tax=Sesamum calycinum TaxID=2727403 RepID=A0AAW2SEB5_9LAMI
MGASPPSSSPFAPLLEDEEQLPSTTTAAASKASKKLALIPLVFLIYFEVAGGPYGEESAVGAAGPLFAILGFLIFPFIWSIPEALVTAELATTFPGNGGFVIWAHKAFGPFWGSMMGCWKLLSGVINLASYPVLCTDYLKLVFPVFSSGFPSWDSHLFGLLNTRFWLPLGYPFDQEKWVDGYFADLALIIAGNWLKIWIEIGAVLSVIGLYEAQLSSCAYQILGMADIGVVPRLFGARSKWFNTPWVGILVSTLVAVAVSYLNFTDIIGELLVQLGNAAGVCLVSVVEKELCRGE